MMWTTVIVASVVCYGIKLAGYSVPQRWLDQPVAQRITVLIPVALLSALVGLWTFTSGQTVEIDARVVGLAAAVVLLIVRAPFLVVILGAAFITAGVRALGWMP